MKKYTFKEHFSELKKRFLTVAICFIAAFVCCYYFSDIIYSFILKPLTQVVGDHERKIIYTGMSEAFFAYLKLSFWAAFLIIIPIIAYQLYGFIAPGLLDEEKAIIVPALVMAPLLFYLGSFFVFYFVMPAAWQFFLSFETSDALMPIVLEARISEYLSVVMQLVTAFGIAFELPIIILILCVMNLVSSQGLKSKRRVAIVIIFIVAAILTPPDVLSQIALAIPLLLLYEISIVICKFIEKRKRGKNA
jgi:sec-independent protein translocase protein TatC